MTIQTRDKIVLVVLLVIVTVICAIPLVPVILYSVGETVEHFTQ